MAQHISRKELKKDEVRETLAHGAEAVLSHQQLTLYLLIAAVIIAAGFFGWKHYSERQSASAQVALDGAMKVFQAQTGNPGTPAMPGELTFPDDKTKFTQAAEKFEDVAKKFPRTHSGELASYYAGLSLEKLNKDSDAKQWLQRAAGSSDESFASLARFELAQLEVRNGQGDEAVKIYQDMMAKPTVLVPKPVVMLALAEYYVQKNPSEAAKLYAQIKSEYPDTPIAQQADQELALLPGKT
ncbi:MAG TPA: tetratricopeptide repeat protein [Candidatus Limnocylindrales bacterium]|nr:tetratricopeptide repeat protein [Candidatus Limnocylindrales bacterium]